MAAVAMNVFPAYYYNVTVPPSPLCNSWTATNRVQGVTALVLRRTPYGLVTAQTRVYFHTPNVSRVRQMPVAVVKRCNSRARQSRKGCIASQPNLALTKKHLSNMPRETTCLQQQALDPTVEIYQQMDMILDYTLKVVFSDQDD